MIQIEDRTRDLRGAVHLDVYKDGKLIESETDHNLIVTVGRTQLAKLLGGGYTGHITKIGVGTGSAAATDTDKGLTGGVLIDIGKVEYDTAKVRFNFEVGTNQANGIPISEFGLFFADGTMFSHRVRKSVIGKENDIKISGYWDIYM